MKRQVRRVYHRILEWLPVGAQRRWLFMKSHRRWLPLHQPQTFSEKTNWRMVFDRRDIIAMTVDKLRARAYAQERGVKVPRLIWSGVDVDDLERSWQEGDEVSWVLKPNFSAGRLLLTGHLFPLGDCHRR